MYFKHVRHYKRHPTVRRAKRRVTLTNFDAILRCYAVIVKMARLRFPGRPGQRIGRNYVSFVYDDLKLNAETCGLTQSKIESGLKLFYDLMGYSDEEEFDGFTAEDLAEAEATLAAKLKQKQALERLLASEVSSPSASEVDKLFTSSDSSDDTSTTSSSVRRCRGMRDIARKSYDKMIKEGLQKPSAVAVDKPPSVKSKNPVKQNVVEKTQSSSDTRTVNAVEATKKDVANSNQCVQEAAPVKKSIVRRLLEKAQHQVKTRRRRRRSMRPNVKKKYRAKFMYSPASKYTKLRQKLPTILESPSSCKDKIDGKKLPPLKAASNNNKGVVCYDSSNSVLSKGEVNPKSKRPFRSRKRFVLPSMSARSSRKIIPRKRYMDDFEVSGRRKAALDEDSQCSRSSLSGSSETISAMDGGSSPEDSQQEDCRQSNKKLQKKVGLLERPLVVEGKRPWKPSLKVQMKLSQMNYDHPFSLKEGDDSTSSGSFKDIIKPDMVSRYAEKMARKPKEKPSVVEDKSSEDSDDEKPGDKLEKVAAKIEKLLKSQWEGRLKDPLQPPPDFGSVAQWRNDQQSMRTSSQRRTKSIIRKARLQLKKRNLNLRTRKTDLDNAMADGKEKSAEPVYFDRICGFVPEVPAPEVNVPFKDSVCASTPSESDPNVKCVVCGFSKIHSSSEKLYDQVACEACNKFFESFAKTPKQYFCTKDGNCCLDGSKESLTRKAINSRCKACWLKVCMEKFTVSAFLRDQLVKYVPRLDVPPHNPLLEVENLEEPEPQPAVEEGHVRGPRIKHVCRRAAVALGLPRATFSENKDSKESFNLSALPQEEKQKILDTVPQEEKEVVESGPAPSELAVAPLPKSSRQPPLKKKPRKDFNKVKNKVRLLKKSSSLLIHKEQKRKKLLMKKSMMKHKHSFKKSLKLGKRKNEMKKTLKFSYKTSLKSSSSPKVVSSMKRPARAKKFRKVRCKQCEGCLAEDCGECAYCLDKKKFGGPNLIKQACMYRRCLRPVMPASERKPAPPSDRRGFGGGPSLSPSSSSSSPTSPDSSCGSSCSSSSSSSSSGSSNSSSSSTQSSSSSTSSSSSGGDVVEPAGREAELCADPAFQQCCGRPAPSLQELVCSSLGSDQQKIYFAEELYRDSTEEEEEEDTIVYEDSSSMIELRNASYAPSLIYGAPRAESEYSTPSFSSNGHKRQRRAGAGDGRKSQFEKDEDMYGSAGSGGQDSNEEDEDSDEDSQKKKHYIYADYWEDYDFDRISSQGLALISSQQVPLPCVCFLCGSVGQEKLIFCVICCEPYHTFCLPEDDVPPEENLENWCCKRCQCCSVCGLKNNLLKCKKCQSTYHSECLTPHYPSKPSRKKRIWMCPKCVKCKSCGTTSPAAPNSGFLWNFDMLLCQPCTKLTDKGSYCPVCKKCYDENDYESEMVQCYTCGRWVHAKCDNISDEWYEILSCLPDNVVYTCYQCSLDGTPMWKTAIKEYLKHGLKSILNSLLAARCARHLISYDQIMPSVDDTSSNSSYSNDTPKIPELRLISRESSISSFSTDRDDIEATVSNLVEMVDQTISSQESTESQGDSSSRDGSIMDERIDGIKNSPDLLVIKKNLVSGKYTTIGSFFDEVLVAMESRSAEGLKHHTSAAKSILIKETEKIFPWFKVPTVKFPESKSLDFPPGMLPNAVLPPSSDHIYSQYLERVVSFPPLSLQEDDVVDTRICVLCGYTGDSMSRKCGRLLYCGQDDWIHINCGLWSAEVFQQQDGSLRNVHPAVSRGRVMHCEFCRQLGATVGCCVRGCPSNYHFYCARKDEAVLQVDRKIFCALHKDHIDERIVSEKDFLVRERVFVHQKSIAPKWVKKHWAAPMDKDCLRVVIGSLTVHKLGRLTSLSGHKNFLIPVDFECTRMFWSTKNPQRRVKYRCRIIEVQAVQASHSLAPIEHTTIVHGPEERQPNPSESSARDNPKEDFEVSDVGKKLRNDVGKVVHKLVKKVAKAKCDTSSSRNNNVIRPVASEDCPSSDDKNSKCRTDRWSSCNGDSESCDEVPKNSKLKCFTVADDKLKSCSARSDGFRDQIDSLSGKRNHSGDNFDKKALLSEFLKWQCSKSSELKRYRKNVKTSRTFDPSAMKLIKLLSDSNFSKEKFQQALREFGDDSGLPPKLKSLLKVVGPREGVTETVLPVFRVGTKENAGVTESSGYSSNDDNHLRQSLLPLSLPGDLSKQNYKDNSTKPTAVVKTFEESKRVINNKLNGLIPPPKQNMRCPEVSDGAYSELKQSNELSRDSLPDEKASQDPSPNGLCQSKGPFKCSKCKRLYRTSESFKKHIDTCNFFLDSSSGEESEDEVSTNTSDESNDALSTKKFRETIGTQSICPDSNSCSESSFKKNSSTRQSESKQSYLDEDNLILKSKEFFSNLPNEQTKPQVLSKVTEQENNLSKHSNFTSSIKQPPNLDCQSGPDHSDYSVRSTEPNLLPPEFLPNLDQPSSSGTYNHSFEHRSQNPNLRSGFETNEHTIVEIDHPSVASNIPMNMGDGGQMAPPGGAFGYNTAVCEDANGGVVQMLLPSSASTIPQPNPMLSQVPNNFLPQPLEMNPSPQVSYVGSITITNNETMSLGVNIQDQMVPIFQQQPDLNFGMMQNPMQVHHQSTEYHLSTVNIQQISVQSSYQTNALNQLVFPQQQVAFPQGQVMFVEEQQAPQNFVFQVPIDQAQAFTTFVPQQEVQTQFVNQYMAAETQHQMGNVIFQQQPTVIEQQQQQHIPAQFVTTDEVPNLVPNTEAASVADPAPSPPVLSRCSTPSDRSSVSVPPNSSIVEILKKAAEQMLSKPKDEAPEKKTRFAHTRKVAARKAEKLRQKKLISAGEAQTSLNKPKTLHLNIATLKSLGLPFLPLAIPPKEVPRPEEGSSASPSLSERSTETPMPPLPPEAANASLIDYNSEVYSYPEEPEEDSPLLKLYLRDMEREGRENSANEAPPDKPYILYEINSEDGLHIKSKSLREAWMKVYDELQDARIAARMDQIALAPEDINGLHMLGLDNPALMYLLEQLPGAQHCSDYDFLFHPPSKDLIEIPENATGCARSEGFQSRREYDMFNFLASEHRSRPVFVPPEEEGDQEGGTNKSSRRSCNMDMPITMRFVCLKTIARETVGVYRSSIHGRGLFSKRNIDPGELVIEYAGEVIRSVLTDKRERIYQSKGIGCYMFRIDDEEVVDATMHGNAARFINHSCEPNCFSKVITVDCKKHIVIFALRRIIKGEELTYDYKFPFEEEKIPCHCNSRRCRKYLN